MRVAKADREHALKMLRKLCPPGSTVFTIVRHVSRSGMSRVISSYVIRKNEPCWLDGYIGNVLGYNRHGHHEGLVIGGCGMDMGFALVHELSTALHGYEGKGLDPKAQCHPHPPTRKRFQAGYSLIQKWL